MTVDRSRLIRTIDAAIRTWAGAPIEWGTSDCTMAIMDIYADVLGRDPAAAYRGRYKTKRGAARILPRGGLPMVVRLVARQQGWRAVKPETAIIGDLGMIKTPDGPACAIRHHDYWLHRIDCGFVALETPGIVLAWSIEI